MKKKIKLIFLFLILLILIFGIVRFTIKSQRGFEEYTRHINYVESNADNLSIQPWMKIRFLEKELNIKIREVLDVEYDGKEKFMSVGEFCDEHGLETKDTIRELNKHINYKEK